MSKVKIFIWILIFAIIAIVLFQNDTLFLGKQALKIDLFFVKYQTPQLPVAIYFLATLVIGLIIAYFFGLSDKFKARKTIKSLTSSLEAQKEEMSSLRREIEMLKDKTAEMSRVHREEKPKPEPAGAETAESEKMIDVQAQPEEQGTSRVVAAGEESPPESEKKEHGQGGEEEKK
ncbi:MAG: DUF1049 domain-containing protein [Deltaproteobacteria bacterium]|nr:DUF1049 domain-containing protein [Deltaproteobacteria bacterium]MBW1963086.1 DUF1049 domain-containing protein [Deltaproteobacteria bacterium]MBW1996307.1 DUF1049 domain-containing protein [Deltaproteobacteria bacterium]MBW2154357.1 DUF1049 domain-containing protein [Deltaproteobacteria bacterium]